MKNRDVFLLFAATVVSVFSLTVARDLAIEEGARRSVPRPAPV